MPVYKVTTILATNAIHPQLMNDARYELYVKIKCILHKYVILLVFRKIHIVQKEQAHGKQFHLPKFYAIL